MTRASSKLFITQQALSKHIQKLERHYNTILFERKPKLRLTVAGEQMLAYAKKSVKDERNLTLSLQENKQSNRIMMPIGISCLRTKAFLPHILMSYHELCPNAIPTIIKGNNSSCEAMLRSGKINMYFGILSEEPSYGKKIALVADSLFFVVGKGLVERVFEGDAEGFLARNAAGISAEESRKFPVILPPPESTLRPVLDNYFERCGLLPQVIAEMSDQDLMLKLCSKEFCACFITKSLLYNLRTICCDEPVYALPTPDISGLSEIGIFYDGSRIPSKQLYDFIECSRKTVESMWAMIENCYPSVLG